ncbi:MAG TPA: S53 family peptidase [Acidimicrobiales bacterium]|jgi:kumamolisin
MRGRRGTRHAATLLQTASLLLGAGAVTGAVGAGAPAGASPVATVPIAGSFLGTPAATDAGPYSAPAMGIEVVLQPSEPAAMKAELAALYDPTSPRYHQWLAPGRFVGTFAPRAGTAASVRRFLRSAGLHIEDSSSPFLVRAVGSSARVAAAFSTSFDTYTTPAGQSFFSDTAPARVPADLAPSVAGVIGLADTAEEHPVGIATASVRSPVAHYGGGPFGSGLTPSQLDGIYGAGAALSAGARGQGRGVTMGVFELSGYTPGDITQYARQFFGSRSQPRLVNVNVDGGPLTPKCPPGDDCHHRNDYGGDIEVEADIETQIALAPRAKSIVVYNAPNDKTGQTSVDEYLKIASDDVADSISTSWGLCEPDIGAATAVAENVAFTEMAMQGQSMTAASGDNGAFDCLRDGTSNAKAVSVDDPSSQPLVTAVGGTSFESFDPGSDLRPTYPTGTETVWNDFNGCNGTPSGLVSCLRLGAGGGGVSVFWPRPSFQTGPGVRPLHNREVPDVSADADLFTPYAEFCTGTLMTNSRCATSGGGWFGIGGTSLSSPLWAGIIGDAVGFNGTRFGTATMTLYPLFRSDYARYFHDITGAGQVENNNGKYPVTPNYDLATGIGTPVIGAIVTGTGAGVGAGTGAGAGIGTGTGTGQKRGPDPSEKRAGRRH